MRQSAPMTCPKCGAQMNHHADKVVPPSEPTEARNMDPDFGGIVHEAHACPRCGAIATRRVAPTAAAS